MVEYCTGVSDNCTADQFLSTITLCRAATGFCDIEEYCAGGPDCPADSVKPSGAECRPALQSCDVAETCDGTSKSCPADGFQPSGVICRSSAGSCDIPEYCTGAFPGCPLDQISPDSDGDGICNVQDDCPLVSDPGQTDSDGDGVGDACDPCNNTFNGGAFATKAKISVSKLLAGLADDKVTIKGYLVLPQTPTIRCDLNGARLLLQKQDGSYIFDATLPPGTYDAVQKVGWKANGAGTKFVYKNAGTPAPLIQGINKTSVGVSTKTSGLVKWSTGGKGGSYGPIVGTDLPLKVTLVLDVPPHSGTSQCGETNFTSSNCMLLSGGKTVKCQIK